MITQYDFVSATGNARTPEQDAAADLKFKAIADSLRAADYAERDAKSRRSLEPRAGVTGQRQAPASAAATYVNSAAGREAIQAERARCAAILAHPEADGRRELAIALACESDLSIEAAGRVMASAPQSAEAAERTEIRAILAMAGGGAAPSTVESEQDEIQRVLAALSGAPEGR